MPPITSSTTESPIPIPQVESAEPVAVVPTASVAPLEGPPDGERINIYTVKPRKSEFPLEAVVAPALNALRSRTIRKPLGTVAAALALGYFVARLTR